MTNCISFYSRISRPGKRWEAVLVT